jgi:hypothetical protein
MNWDELEKRSAERAKLYLAFFAGMKKEAAEYQGRDVELNKPIRNPSGSNKKFKVYVKDPKSGKVKKVQFGDPNMDIKGERSAKKQKNFRARHNCDNPGPKTKARYWSCYQWRPGKKVKD